jgi:hypothetical protein
MIGSDRFGRIGRIERFGRFGRIGGEKSSALKNIGIEVFICFLVIAQIECQPYVR